MNYEKIFSSILRESMSNCSLRDFLDTENGAFILFIKEKDNKYSDSSEAEMYNRNYDFRFPEGAKYFTKAGGYLRYFKLKNLRISSNFSSENEDVLNLLVRKDNEVVTVFTDNERQTDLVEYIFEKMCPTDIHDESKSDSDIIKSKIKFGLSDYIGGRDSKIGAFIKAIEDEDFCPIPLVNFAVMAKDLKWNDIDKVYVQYVAADKDKVTFDIIDYGMTDPEIIKEQSMTVSAELFEPRNGYFQNCPNPSNFDFDRPGFTRISFQMNI